MRHCVRCPRRFPKSYGSKKWRLIDASAAVLGANTAVSPSLDDMGGSGTTVLPRRLLGTRDPWSSKLLAIIFIIES